MMVFSVRSRNDECVNEMSASSVVGGGAASFVFVFTMANCGAR